MPPKQDEISLNQNRFEVLTEGEIFLGIGKVWIGETLVRSGRLPMTPVSHSFQGRELDCLKLVEIKSTKSSIRIVLDACFKRLLTRQMRDHSLDPIHDTGDWSENAPDVSGRMELVLKPAKDEFYGVKFQGFSYHFTYRSRDLPLFWLLDRASWELDGNIRGATAVSQSPQSEPVVTFGEDTVWSTEGTLDFLLDNPEENSVMTHNLPRWASHGSFDYQYKRNKTLIGVFENVGLIRSVVCRDAGQGELKHFDKHIFDETKRFKTVAKKILLNIEKRSEVQQQNLWTWIHEDVEERARQEFGLEMEPCVPFTGKSYWNNFTADTMYMDMLPAAEAVGFKQIFVGQMKKSADSDRTPFPGKFNWNHCCPHEFEIAPERGGNERVAELVRRARENGIEVKSWTNDTQSLSSPYNSNEREPGATGRYVLMDDTRTKYGGAYSMVMSILDMNQDEPRQYFIDAHKKIKEETGLGTYLFDSFYNLGFMPITYRCGRPRTVWKSLLQAFKILQDADIHFSIESFGPFGKPMHGHAVTYNIDTIFACYRIGFGTNYTAIPVDGKEVESIPLHDPDFVYTALAHMALLDVPLFMDDKRVDEVWGDAHRQALKDYHEVLPNLRRRILQEDGKSVIWWNLDGDVQTVFSFAEQSMELEGTVMDITTGEKLSASNSYILEPQHTYVVK